DRRPAAARRDRAGRPLPAVGDVPGGGGGHRRGGRGAGAGVVGPRPRRRPRRGVRAARPRRRPPGARRHRLLVAGAVCGALVAPGHLHPAHPPRRHRPGGVRVARARAVRGGRGGRGAARGRARGRGAHRPGPAGPGGEHAPAGRPSL
ncbi:MAG: hypothetical protein AVDCRST_MAG66-3186, partial [uncultured Pseudonocardia sp.]